jgi:ubiquinone biosynthesis monooxygenase Coq7
MPIQFSLLDKLCLHLDAALKTLAPHPHQKAQRSHGAENITEANLNTAEKKEIAALMRVNHVGEVCAQGLYRGQALTARLESVQDQMNIASNEEQDHLHWCAERIKELGGHTSYLNPLFYVGSFALGAIAGACGDKWSLGFVAETEKQVGVHLQSHLDKLNPNDLKTKAILEKMQQEEEQHGKMAMDAGGTLLPSPIKIAMQIASKCMTSTSYYL